MAARRFLATRRKGLRLRRLCIHVRLYLHKNTVRVDSFKRTRLTERLHPRMEQADQCAVGVSHHLIDHRIEVEQYLRKRSKLRTEPPDILLR